ncbi:hypothetical protein [Kocuria flava]|nr:hypothetical protein [Kocuria flava]
MFRAAESQLIPLTIHEIRGLFNRIAHPIHHLPGKIWHWSSW